MFSPNRPNRGRTGQDMSLSKADMIDLLGAIDLVGMSLCAHANGHEMTDDVICSTIQILGTVRAQIAEEFGIKLDPCAAIPRDFPTKDEDGKPFLSPAEAAEEIMKDLF